MDGTAFTLDQSGKQTGAALVKVRVDSPPQDKHTLESRAQTRASGEEKRPQSRYNTTPYFYTKIRIVDHVQLRFGNFLKS